MGRSSGKPGARWSFGCSGAGTERFCRGEASAEAEGMRSQTLLYKPGGLRGDGRIVAETGQPADTGLAAKPGELAFGVVAMTLGGSGSGESFGRFTAEDSARLAVAERIEGAGRVAVFCDQ